MEQTNDLSSVRVGDKLWCSRYGECVVIRVSEGTDYPIIVSFIGNDGFWSFDFEGKNLETDPLPSLFWSKPTIIFPPPPEEVEVKGWVGFVRLRYSNTTEIYARDELFGTEAEANRYADKDPSIPRAVFVCHKFRK